MKAEVKKVGNIYGFTGGNFAGSVWDQEGASPTISTMQGGGQEPMIVEVKMSEELNKWVWEIDGVKYLIRIRKLTPRECWRLMTFSDEDFDKAASVNSNSQLYKQAGNAIVKDVLADIIRQLI